jgi:hypothetical protein
MKPAKKPAKKATKSAAKSAVKSTQKRTIKGAVKRTQKRTPTTIKLTPLSKLILKWDKDQGPLPTLYDTATKLDEVVNTLTDIQHLMDSALDDCVNMNNEARSMALMHLAYGMIKGAIDKLDPLTTDLYRINRAQLDLK